MAYELWLAAGETAPFHTPRHTAPPAEVAQLELLFADVERALWTVEFFKTRQTENVLRSVRQMVHRAELDERETSLLRAMCIEVVKYFRRITAPPAE